MKRAAYLVEGVLQGFVALGAVVAGAMLIAVPDGGLLGMSPDMLARSPFGSFLVPGIILVLVNGVGNAVSAVLCFRAHPLAPWGGMVFGFALAIWIFVQVIMIGGGEWIQYMYFSLGVLMILGGIAMREAEIRGL